jgi:hypothetical protein
MKEVLLFLLILALRWRCGGAVDAAQQLNIYSLNMPAGARHIFVDDVLIDHWSGGVGVRQGSPLRVTTDRPVLVADAPWEVGCLVYWFSSALRSHDNPAELARWTLKSFRRPLNYILYGESLME